MVAVRISRQSVEAGAPANAVVDATRIDAEVAISAQGTTTGTVRDSRISIEVLGPRPVTATATRLDAEVATQAQSTTTGTVRVSRESIEVGARIIKRAAITRVDAEAAINAQGASTGPVKISRIALELLARRGSAGPVVPLPLADGIDVFLHNWADAAILTSAYLTDVSVAPTTGAESRRSLKIKPARTLSFTWQTHANDEGSLERLERLRIMLNKLTNERIAVPLYMDQRELDAAYLSSDDTILFDTSRARFFQGARVAIVQFDYHAQYLSHSFHIIESLEDSSLTFTANLGVNVAARSVVIPMIDCEVELEAKAKYRTSRNMTVSMDLSEVEGSSQLPAVKSDFPNNTDTFDDAPIFDFNIDWLAGMERGRERDGQRYTQGKTQQVYKGAERSKEYHKINLTGYRSPCAANVRDDIWRVVEFFDTRRGRARSFWFIDQEQIWNPVSVDPSGTFIGIEEFGDFDDFEDELEGGWVGLEMANGTRYVREAVTVQQVLTVYRITVSPDLPAGLDVNNVVRVARARRSRFDKDEIQENWEHTGYMGTSLEIVEVLNEKNVDI